ncbi:MAG: hypothetical protein ACK5KM_12720 [Hyphomicrobiaceae bacterium]
MPTSESDPRIDKMFRNDSIWAVVAVLALWALYGFVFYELVQTAGVEDTTILTVLAIGGSLVVLFNTASIFAMIKHYSEDKQHIYGLDVHYIDLARNASKKVPDNASTHSAPAA